MSTSNKKKLILSAVSVHIGCNSCRKPNLAAIFTPFPKLKKLVKIPTTRSSGSLASTPTTTTTTASSSTATTDEQWEFDKSPSKERGLESLAVEKDSDDPYLDFRQSMLQMIVENEIYSEEGLRELLKCFLHLNSPYHHGIIVRAFTEIWDGVFSSAACGSDCSYSDCYAEQHHYGPFVPRDHHY